MDLSLWGPFHDGTIQRVEGAVPGDVSLFIAIPYLRSRFSTQGTGFVIKLSGCTQFSFQPWDGPMVSCLADIAALEPEVLDVELGGALEIRCTIGMLSVCYSGAALFLDSGNQIQVSELNSASRDYWNEWSARASAAP